MQGLKEIIIVDKSFAFSVRIVNLYNYLVRETHYITDVEFESMHCDLLEILKILTAICKHYPQNNQR